MVLLFLLAPVLAQDPEAQAIRQALQTPTPAQLLAPDPLKWLKSTNELAKRARIGQATETLAKVLILIGFVFALYQAMLFESARQFGFAVARLALCSLLVQLSLNYAQPRAFSFSALMFNGWIGAYAWILERSGDQVQQKIEEAEGVMLELLSQVVVTGGSLALGGVGVQTAKTYLAFSKGAVRDLLILDGTSAGAQAAKSALGAATGAARQTGLRVIQGLKVLYQFMLPLLAAYAALIYISGLLVLLCIYLLPLAFALLMWNQRSWVSGVLSTYTTALFTVIFLPLFFTVALDIAFVQPAQVIQRYNDQLAQIHVEAKAQTAKAQAQVNQESQALIAACEAAYSADPEAIHSVACQEARSRGFLERLGDRIGQIVASGWSAFTSLISAVFNSIVATVLGLLAVWIGLFIGLMIMFRLPSMIGSIVGGGTAALSELRWVSRGRL
jgi:hypothetical protein